MLSANREVDGPAREDDRLVNQADRKMCAAVRAVITLHQELCRGTVKGAALQYSGGYSNISMCGVASRL